MQLLRQCDSEEGGGDRKELISVNFLPPHFLNRLAALTNTAIFIQNPDTKLGTPSLPAGRQVRIRPNSLSSESSHKNLVFVLKRLKGFENGTEEFFLM